MELAARIGQSLLKKNRALTEQNDYLEERVGQIAEEVHPQDGAVNHLPHMLLWQRTQGAVFPQVAQLHHELNLKDELLQFYTSAAEESEDESCSSPMLEAAL